MSERLARLARAEGRLAVDTEFVTERRYRPLLCLVQVAARDADAGGEIATEIVDPLTADVPDELPETLASPDVQVVVHAGRQDVALLKRTWDTQITNVFDTQVAAAFLGYGVQESYRTLVGRVLGHRIESGEAFTRWDRRPLSEDQLRYAAEDALHLLELGEALERELEQAGRLEWAREESRRLEDVSDERDPEAIFRRLSGAGRLRPQARAIARELVDWRESTASELDRNAGSVLPDHVLVELARRPPRDRGALADVRGLPEATRHRRGRELVEAIARGGRREPPARAARAGPPSSSLDAPLAALLSAVVRRRSMETGIAAQVIATQEELGRLVAAVREGRDLSELPVATGWRRELVGAELLELLGGRRAVGVDERLDLVVLETGSQAAG